LALVCKGLYAQETWVWHFQKAIQFLLKNSFLSSQIDSASGSDKYLHHLCKHHLKGTSKASKPLRPTQDITC